MAHRFPETNVRKSLYPRAASRVPSSTAAGFEAPSIHGWSVQALKHECLSAAGWPADAKIRRNLKSLASLLSQSSAIVELACLAALAYG